MCVSVSDVCLSATPVLEMATVAAVHGSPATFQYRPVHITTVVNTEQFRCIRKTILSRKD